MSYSKNCNTKFSSYHNVTLFHLILANFRGLLIKKLWKVCVRNRKVPPRLLVLERESGATDKLPVLTDSACKTRKRACTKESGNKNNTLYLFMNSKQTSSHPTTWHIRLFIIQNVMLYLYITNIHSHTQKNKQQRNNNWSFK